LRGKKQRKLLVCAFCCEGPTQGLMKPQIEGPKTDCCALSDAPLLEQQEVFAQGLQLVKEVLNRGWFDPAHNRPIVFGSCY
jgi:hypothetical protein